VGRFAGWFWWQRQRGFAINDPAGGPFPASYSAYRAAFSRLPPEFSPSRFAASTIGLVIAVEPRPGTTTSCSINAHHPNSILQRG